MSDAANNAAPPPGGPPDLETLAGEYVLGTLSWARRQQVDAQLRTDALLRAAVAEWEARLWPLTALAQPVEPTLSLWSRIAQSVDRQEFLAKTSVNAADDAPAPAPAAAGIQPSTADTTGTPPSAPAPAARTDRATLPRAAPPRAVASASFWGSLWRNLALWRGLAGAGFAAAMVLAVVLLSGPGLAPTAPGYLVVLVAPANQSAGWIVQAKSTGQLELQPVGAGADAALPADKSLQFWTKADGWSKPVSLGLVTPGQTLRIPLDALPPLQGNQLFELTIEPAGGSPTQLPTGPIQFIGRAVKLAI